MTKVLIVSRTRMGANVCIGGLNRETLESVRLCPTDGRHDNPPDSPYQIGEVWDLTYEPSSKVESPHLEDVVVSSARYVAPQSGMATYLESRVKDWSGSPQSLFDGALVFNANGSGYVPDDATLDRSVGFWKPNGDLKLQPGDSPRYRYTGFGPHVSIKYVGVADPVDVIPAGSLVRVSLSRRFAPSTGPNACWLQLSGWYLD